MASPEAAPTNRLEGAEREASVLERVEQSLSPEEQVEQAMKAAEAMKKEFDPVQADAEMARNQSEYAERLFASPESIAEADDSIAGELSAIKKEEMGLLEKLNAKLRKYTGVVELVAATAGPAAAMENPGGGLQPETDDQKIVEMIPDDVPKPELPKIFQMDTSLSSPGAVEISSVDIGREPVSPEKEALTLNLDTNPEALGIVDAASETEQSAGGAEVSFDEEGNQESFFQEVAKDHIPEQSGNERFLEQQKTDEYVERMQKSFERMEFSNEHEMLDFLREIAESAPFEFYAVYGLDDFGHLKKFSGGFGSGTSAEIDPEILQDARTRGITKLVFAHTHPNKAIESQVVRDVFSAEERRELFDRGRIDMPPSGADIRMAGELDWIDYYDNPTKSEGWSVVETRGVVVTSDAVWKYRTDFFHPAMERQREEVIQLVEKDPNFQEWKSKHKLSDDEAHDILRVIQIPDNFVRARVFLNPKYYEAFRDFNFYDFITLVKMGTELNKDASQFAWVEEQKKVVLASPEEKAAAIERFISFSKENGVDMEYVPFDRKEQ